MEDEGSLDEEDMIEKVTISSEKSPLKQKPVVEVKNTETWIFWQMERLFFKIQYLGTKAKYIGSIADPRLSRKNMF